MVFLGGITAFKSVQSVEVDSSGTYADEKPLDERFFVPAAAQGVRHIKILERSVGGNPEVEANTVDALSFGFADPTAGGDRSLFYIDCAIGKDFLAQVKQVRQLLSKDSTE